MYARKRRHVRRPIHPRLAERSAQHSTVFEGDVKGVAHTRDRLGVVDHKGLRRAGRARIRRVRRRRVGCGRRSHALRRGRLRARSVVAERRVERLRRAIGNHRLDAHRPVRVIIHPRSGVRDAARGEHGSEKSGAEERHEVTSEFGRCTDHAKPDIHADAPGCVPAVFHPCSTRVPPVFHPHTTGTRSLHRVSSTEDARGMPHDVVCGVGGMGGRAPQGKWSARGEP
jgi:hypothetical protein